MSEVVFKVLLPDSTLVKLARCGDHNAFAELMRRHQSQGVDIAMYYLDNRADAEDGLQDALLKAWTFLEQYRGEGEFFCWLRRIVRNECRC